jgi:hypothetical protein
MMIWTLEGNMTGKIEDYLIKGVRGEFISVIEIFFMKLIVK